MESSLDFKIDMQPKKLNDHIEPDVDLSVDKYDSLYVAAEDDTDNQNKQLIIQDYDLRQAAHPLVCLGVLFANAFPCVAFVLSDHFIFCCVIVSILQFSCFLYTKNICAQQLVGLRWGYDLKKQEWTFSNEEGQSNIVDRAFFWTSLSWSTLFWLVMGLFTRIFWFPLTVSCMCLQLLNLYGFSKCRGAHQKKLQKLKQEVNVVGMNIVGMILH